MRVSCVLILCAVLALPLVAGAQAATDAAMSSSQDPIKCTDASLNADETAQLNNLKPKNEVPLSVVLKSIIAGITCYQTYAADAKPVATPSNPKPAALLPLTKAMIDLKTVTTSAQGVTISFAVLSINFGHTSTSTTDFLYTYEAPPPPKNVARFGKKKPEKLSEAIANAMLTASDLAAENTIPGMSNTNYTITLSFAVDYKGGGGVTLPIQAVTLGGTVSGEKNTTQQVTLTFGKVPAPAAHTP